ncbi:MAG: ABC transporter transmembrane domain-containing protein, partial [Clostridia bacterium]
MDSENYKTKPRNVGPNKVHEKPKDFKVAIKKLLHYLNKLLPFIIIALLLSSLSSVLSIVGPNKLSDLTDEITNGLTAEMNFDAIKSIAIFLFTIYLISALFDYIQGFTMATVANKFAKGLRAQISTKINRLPLKYFDKHSYGDILSRVTNDVDTIATSLNQSLGTLVSATTLL